MDITWLLVVMAAAVFVSMVLLVAVCLNCRDKGPLDSNPSYENPVVVESDNDDPGYIIVLPEGATPVTNQSRASTPSSDVLHDYENVPEKKSDSRGEYLNVENFHSELFSGHVIFFSGEAWSPSLSRPLFGCESSAQSKSSDDDDDDDDDDGDSDSEGNYVNVNEAPL
ncbi:hypothetical protein D9C73_026578 [Collichthys lucidus]|uniref:Uncharacterized protein n=1 Tax=Collichthys lucidus TaxID=240159 RepID=A0A4U5VRH7_COLLU|nr:hypothetical protein D9C73_026578 [Collichthys lucidus]